MPVLSDILGDSEKVLLDIIMTGGGSKEKGITEKQRIEFLQDIIWKLHFDIMSEPGNPAIQEWHQSLLRSTDVNISRTDA